MKVYYEIRSQIFVSQFQMVRKNPVGTGPTGKRQEGSKVNITCVSNGPSKDGQVGYRAAGGRRPVQDGLLAIGQNRKPVSQRTRIPDNGHPGFNMVQAARFDCHDSDGITPDMQADFSYINIVNHIMGYL